MAKTRTIQTLFVAIILVFLPYFLPAQSGPSNQFFPGLTISGVDGFSEGSTTGAAVEPGEPEHAGQSRTAGTVWYSWTAPSTAVAIFTTCAFADFDTIMAVYVGDSVDDLVEVVANDDDDCGSQSRVYFDTEQGVTYRIVVTGYRGDEGAFRLDWLSYAGVSPNGTFPGATITGGSGRVVGNTVGAGREPDEPVHADSADESGSVWYSWTAPFSGPVTFSTCQGATFDTVLAVYTGNAVNALTEVVSNDDGCGVLSRVAFTADQGTIYRIAVAGYRAEEGGFILDWAPPPVYFTFPGMSLLTDSGVLDGTTDGAGREPGEPVHAGSADESGSAWFSWTASFTGPVWFSTCLGATFDTVLAVYTGNAVNALTEVVSNDDECDTLSRVNFEAQEGTTYRIAVAGYGDEEGNFRLSWNPPPTYWIFPGQSIVGESGVFSGTTVGGYREPGEPIHAEVSDASGSAWFSWVAPISGPALFSTCEGTDYDSVLAVYTGDTVDDLVEIAANDDGDECPGTQSLVRFEIQAGVTYRIVVAGYRDGEGEFTLAWQSGDGVDPGPSPSVWLITD